MTTGAIGAGTAGPRRVSMNPTTFTEGAKIDDVDVTVVDARWCYFDYRGKSDNGPALVLGLGLQTADGKVHEEYLSSGDKEYFRPSQLSTDGIADGGVLVPTGNRDGLSATCNAALFIKSLIAAGYPTDVLDRETITGALVGLGFHVIQMPQPKRAGLTVKRPGQAAATAGQADRAQTFLAVAKINTFPPVTGIANTNPPPPIPMQQPAAAKIATAPTPAPTAQVGAIAAAAPELDTLCTDILVNILAERGGSVLKKDLAGLAFRALADHPLKKVAVPRIFDDAFLTSAKGIRYDGAKVELA